MRDVFFVVGCARSGTTALARVLGTATNARVTSEQEPKLCIESRQAYEGTLTEPGSVLRQAREAAIASARSEGMIYGDKSMNYLPFIELLSKTWDCNFLFLFRDGRDVVRSLMDWHHATEGSIFGSAEDELSSTITQEQDWWDYSRLRPRAGEPFKDQWIQLSRLQKCAWYWARYNELALQSFDGVARNRWISVDMSDIDSQRMGEVFQFLGLEGFDQELVDGLLRSRVNSAWDRAGLADRFPRWPDWSDTDRQSFINIAGTMMHSLGYQWGSDA